MKRLFAVALMTVALWAADFAGKWKVVSSTPDGEMQLMMVITEADGKFQVKISTDQGDFQVKDVESNGDSLSFSASTGEATYKTKLQLSGNTLEGTFIGTDGVSGKVKATRQ